MRIRALLLLLICCVACRKSSSGTAIQTRVPEKPVQLVVDNLGITHVLAQTDEDAFYGGGYAMARDRLFQMDLTRHQANGTQAEIYGDQAVSWDEQTRLFNFKALGAADYALLQKNDPTGAAMVDAWVAGVNQFIADVNSGKVPLPTGFGTDGLNYMPTPWTSADVLTVGKLLAWGLSGTLNQDILVTVLQRIAPDTFQRVPLLMPGFDSFIVPTRTASPTKRPKGHPLKKRAHLSPQALAWRPMRGLPKQSASNNWAVTGQFTDSGTPLLAGDPHQSLDSPNPFWPVHLSSTAGGGTIDEIGFSFPGTAGIELGMNEHVAWTATVAQADVTDVWDVAVSSDWSTADIGNQSMPIKSRVETITVRDQGMPAVTGHTVQFTYHEIPGYGVFIPEEILPVPLAFVADNQLLMNWTGFSATTEAEAYFDMSGATDLTSWQAAASHLQVGAVNFIAADKTGILAYTPANVPDRGNPSSRPMPWHVMDGSNAATYWTGQFLPIEHLVHVLNPVRGYLVSANNDPFGFTADGSVEDDPWYYGSIYAKGQRSYRIEQVLSKWITEKHKITRTDMETLQSDVHSVTADAMQPVIADAVGAIGTDSSLSQWQGKAGIASLGAALAAWNGNYDKDKGAPVVFQGFMWFATKRLLQDKLTPQLFGIVPGSDPQLLQTLAQNILTGHVADGDGFFMPNGPRAIVVGALSDTDDWLNQRFGTDNPAKFKWSDLHGDDFSALLSPQFNVPHAAVSGGPDTVNVSGAPFFDSSGNPLINTSCHEGSAYRMVVGFGSDGEPEATLDFALGASGDPKSSHALDQQPNWLAVKHVALPFRPSEVQAAMASSVTLPPAK